MNTFAKIRVEIFEFSENTNVTRSTVMKIKFGKEKKLRFYLLLYPLPFAITEITSVMHLFHVYRTHFNLRNRRY